MFIFHSLEIIKVRLKMWKNKNLIILYLTNFLKYKTKEMNDLTIIQKLLSEKLFLIKNSSPLIITLENHVYESFFLDLTKKATNIFPLVTLKITVLINS